MAGARVEKYRRYRQSIAARSDNIPVLKTPSQSDDFADEAGFFKKIRLKNRVINYSITLVIVLIIALLVVFGFIVF